MKKNIQVLILLLILLNEFANAQICPFTVHAQSHRITSDTTIVYNNTPFLKSWVPCIGKSVHLDSIMTEIDTFYLREGTKLIIDSNSTLAGGFVIYADSGSYVDCNFHQVQELYYTPYTTVKDTSAWGVRTMCSDLIFDFSQMIEAHDCFPTAISEPSSSIVGVYTSFDSWRVQLNSSNYTSAYLYNLQGEMMSKYNIKTTQFEISNSNLPKGIYVLKIFNNKTAETIKLSKY